MKAFCVLDQRIQEEWNVVQRHWASNTRC